MPLDIASGIFISMVAAYWFDAQATPLLMGFAILSALAPDIDMLPPLQRINHDHRSFFHWPLLYAVPTVVVLVTAGTLYALVFALGILAHLVHDTIGIGWGVAWLAPFSDRKFLFPERGRRREYGWFMTWLPHEEELMAEKYHDEDWLKTYYFRPNMIAYVEYTAFAVSILALAVYYVVL